MSKKKKYAGYYHMANGKHYMVYKNSIAGFERDFRAINNCYKIKIYDSDCKELLKVIV